MQVNPKEYKFFLVNFGWYSQRTAKNLEEAKDIARSIGFEVSVIDHENNRVAFWSPIGGWRSYEK